MPNPLKQLAGQTAIYGLSSIVGRFLNYLLVPLHTAQFITLQYGIITEMYAYVAFLVVLLTYGMETAYFRFSSTEEFDKKSVYGTAVFSLLASTTVFIAFATTFSIPIAEWLHYPNHTEYIIWFAIIVGLDAVSAIPLARLRAENKAKTFTAVNIANVAVNIGLNVFWVGYCMPVYEEGGRGFLIENFYNPEIGVGYVFIANLVASVCKFLLLTPIMLKAGFNFQFKVLKKLLWYGSPLLLAGLAGIVNETIDRIMLKRMLWDDLGEVGTLSQLGIYGACYKISIIITLFIQAFRYAAEPFFFSQENQKNAKDTYAKVMNYFVIVCTVIFLGVMLFLDIIKHFLQNEDYWQGLGVVPILLMANIFLGIYFNLSIWYKLTNKTIYGAYLSVFGALITIALNYWLIPKIGYMGSAWATLACYVSMVIASYIIGQRHYKVNYDLRKILLYIAMALGLYFLSDFLKPDSVLMVYVLNTSLFIGFAIFAWMMEKPKISTNYE